MAARAGPRNLITDVPGILIGQAEDHAAISGTTVGSPRRQPQRRSMSAAVHRAAVKPNCSRPALWSIGLTP
jgi:L-aminopeptidase/D-esterase-like protein